MINLKEEFKTLIKDFNNYIIIRSLTDKRCICWRPESNTPDTECPNCQGQGWLYEEWIQKCKFFFVTHYKPVAHLHNFDYGMVYTNLLGVYLEAKPKARQIKMGDYIFEVGCYQNGRIINPIKRVRKWQITDYFDMQLDQNKTEFIKLYATPMVV